MAHRQLQVTHWYLQLREAVAGEAQADAVQHEVLSGVVNGRALQRGTWHQTRTRHVT